ncbi:MAG: aminotransferase class IV [Solirubrobacterales bacterium]|nr:aminotransferase class IV [Solirubrobacterales bacterium]
MASDNRPDPALGIFETMLVLGGHPVELGAHLARIAASLDAAYGAELPGTAGDLVRERSRGLELGRLRLNVIPAGAGLRCEAVASAVDPVIFFPDREHGAELRTVELGGGLGGDKWADRSALPVDEDGSTPLLLDRGGEVLEAGWANVFAARDGHLLTPRTDGRILPGIARAATIEIAAAAGIEVREGRLDRDELLSADEVFLTGSVRGIGPARSLDGVALGDDDRLSRLLAEELRRRWSGAG